PTTVAAADTRSEPVVVVFPFENLGPPEEAYFAAGVTDEIITRLTGVAGLRVVSRASALHYDRTGTTMQQIATDLGVDYVLEGAVRWQRDAGGTSRVRVTPQLMNARSDEQVWAESYDRSMAEIFKVQSEIAEEVVHSLGVTLAVSPAPKDADIPTRDMNAYHAYLRAREILDVSQFNAESWFLAVDLLEKAVARDPEFHEAWGQLAKANSGMCHFDWDRTEARLARAKAAADRAFELKPDAAYTQMARGLYYYWGRKDYESALAALRQADRARPNDSAIRELMAYVLRRQEDYAEAAEILIDVNRLSPRDPANCAHIGETLGILGRYDEAATWAARAIELGPGQATNYTMAAWLAVEAGRPELVRRYIEDTPPSSDPEIRYGLFKASYALRDYAAALRQADALPDVYEAQFSTVSRHLALAQTHLAMDMTDTAREDFVRAEAVLAAKLMEKPGAGNLVAARAVALAGLGRGDEALAEIERAFGLYPASKDRWIQTWRLYDLALVQMLTGRSAEAVATLGELLKRRTDVISPSILRSTPDLDGLRGRPDFQGLLVGGA
ncbi:tetratricopeptide repeat protein, partial [bacterium]|nr:tetratricopeptide repeat protein [bacterium]